MLGWANSTPWILVLVVAELVSLGRRAWSVLLSPQTSTWPLAATQTKEVPMAFVGNMGHRYQHRSLLPQGQTQTWSLTKAQCQGLTMAIGGRAGYSHEAVPHYPLVSSSSSLHRAHTILLLFLSHFSTTYKITLVTPASLLLGVTFSTRD